MYNPYDGNIVLPSSPSSSSQPKILFYKQPILSRSPVLLVPPHSNIGVPVHLQTWIIPQTQHLSPAQGDDCHNEDPLCGVIITTLENPPYCV